MVLQGGGGGFGVVVSLTIRMYPLSEILTGVIIFPLDQAAAVLRGYMRLIYQQPDAFGCMMFFMHNPTDGTPVFALAPCWTGDMEEGKEVIRQFEQLGTPLVSQVGRMPWIGMLEASTGEQFKPGRANHVDGRCLADVNDAAIDALVEAGRSLPPPLSCIVIHDLHGAASRVAPTATAYPIRQPHLAVIINSIEDGTRVTDTARAWVKRLSDKLVPHSLSQDWPQFVGGAEEDMHRVQQTYRDKLPHLMAVKQRVDPRNLFSSTVVPLPL